MWLCELTEVSSYSVSNINFGPFCCSENDQAFDILYCITFKLMDQQWLDMHATYMDFNVCSFSTKSLNSLDSNLSFLDLIYERSIDNWRIHTLGPGNNCSPDCTTKTADGHEINTASARKGAFDRGYSADWGHAIIQASGPVARRNWKS